MSRALHSGHRLGSGKHFAPLQCGKGEEQTGLQNGNVLGQRFQTRTLQVRPLHEYFRDSRPFLPRVLSAAAIHCAQLKTGLLSTAEKRLNRDFHAVVKTVSVQTSATYSEGGKWAEEMEEKVSLQC